MPSGKDHLWPWKQQRVVSKSCHGCLKQRCFPQPKNPKQQVSRLAICSGLINKASSKSRFTSCSNFAKCCSFLASYSSSVLIGYWEPRPTYLADTCSRSLKLSTVPGLILFKSNFCLRLAMVLCVAGCLSPCSSISVMEWEVKFGVMSSLKIIHLLQSGQTLCPAVTGRKENVWNLIIFRSSVIRSGLTNRNDLISFLV